MIKVVLCSFVIAALFQSVLGAIPVGPRPNSVCWLQRLNRNRFWIPSCYGFLGVYFTPEQCDYSGNCWCVKVRTGQSISSSYHVKGLINCHKTQMECKSTQVYSMCGSCQKTCADKEAPKTCTLQCQVGCTCPAGMFVDGDRCVVESECPAPPTPVCNVSLGEVYNGNCAPACEPTCAEPNKFCTLQCTQRCTCPPNYARDANNVCIPKEQCPVTCDAFLNEHYSACAPLCDLTCDQSMMACHSTKRCAKRCACRPGFVRNDQNVCVASSQCPLDNEVVTTTTPMEIYGLKRCQGRSCYCVHHSTGQKLTGTEKQKDFFDLDCDYLGECPGSMEFSSCASSCPSTCEDPMPRCVRSCMVDCVCPQGTIRASKTDNRCILLDECQAPHTCQYVRYTTFSSVRLSCAADGTWEPTQCYDNGTCWCVDKQGVMIPNTMSDTPIIGMDMPTCVDARKCDASKGQVWSMCAPPCDEVCGGPYKACAAQLICSARCACKPGYMLDIDGSKCIPKDQCIEQAPPVCDDSKKEVWNDCGKMCDGTCDNPNPQCANLRICKQRCSCPNNHVRNSFDICVPLTQCSNLGKRTSVETECQKNRRINSNPMMLDAFVPECDPDTGHFLPKQCYGFLLECWCVEPLSGEEVPDSRGGPQWEFKTDCNTFGRSVTIGSGEMPPLPPSTN